MNRLEKGYALCDLCEDLIQEEDARIVCPDCFTAAQNIPTWHPIETAPRDGQRFLFTNGHIVGTGLYVAGKYFAADSWQGTHTPTIPTHWMPLPELPQKDGE